MNQFLSILRAEREALDPITRADGLAAARKVLEDARRQVEAAKASSGRSFAQSDVERRLLEAVTDAEARVAEIEVPAQRARDRIAEIDRLLNADRAESEARAHLGRHNSQLREARFDFERYGRIETELKQELAALEAKRVEEIRMRGIADVQARLSGKPAVAQKLTVADTDIATRVAALEALAPGKADAQAQLDSAQTEWSEARNRFVRARQALAEIAYFEMLPKLMPVLAQLRATGSNIRQHGYAADFLLPVDAASVEAARRQLEAEIEGA